MQKKKNDKSFPHNKSADGRYKRYSRAQFMGVSTQLIKPPLQHRKHNPSPNVVSKTQPAPGSGPGGVRPPKPWLLYCVLPWFRGSSTIIRGLCRLMKERKEPTMTSAEREKPIVKQEHQFGSESAAQPLCLQSRISENFKKKIFFNFNPWLG